MEIDVKVFNLPNKLSTLTVHFHDSNNKVHPLVLKFVDHKISDMGQATTWNTKKLNALV